MLCVSYKAVALYSPIVIVNLLCVTVSGFVTSCSVGVTRRDFSVQSLSLLQGWDKFGDYTHVAEFLEAMKARPSWGPSAPVNDDVVAQGWKMKTEMMKSG